MYKALIISVNQYLNVSNLPNTVNDAREIKRLLLEAPSLFENRNVLEIQGTLSNKDILLTAIKSFFKNTNNDDILFLYWAGHGAFINNEGYFVPFDGNSSDPDNSLIKMSYIREVIDSTSANTVLSFFDTCHSGAIARKLQEEMIRGIEVKGDGKVLIAACSQEEGAWDRGGHGAFTDYLIRGLEGAAADQDGNIDVYNLYSYISNRLKEEFNDQNPIIKSTLSGPPLLLKRIIDRKVNSSDSKVPSLNKVVKNSGSSFLLGSIITKYDEYQEIGDGTYQILLENPEVSIEQAIKKMNQSQYPFAIRNEAHVVKIENIDTKSTKNGTIVTVKLINVKRNQYSMLSNMTINEGGKSITAVEIAEMRARRILFDDKSVPSKSHFSLLESAISKPAESYVNVVPNLIFKLVNQGLSIEEIRVALIGSLILTNTVEIIESLDLEVEDNTIKGVHLIGYRPKYYTNVEPEKIEIKGPLNISEASEI